MDNDFCSLAWLIPLRICVVNGPETCWNYFEFDQWRTIGL